MGHFDTLLHLLHIPFYSTMLYVECFMVLPSLLVLH